MDRVAELMGRHGARHSRRGSAMAAALFAISAAAILTASVHWMTRADLRMTSNRESSVRALAIAEAGLAHALALVKNDLGDTTMTRLLRGWDGVKNTADDGLLVGYNLPTATQIPLTGRTITGGTYFVNLTDDPAEVDNDVRTDRNTRIVAVCRGVASNGSTATIHAVVGNSSLAGVSIDGNLTVSGTTTLTGRCGGVHTNGNLTLSTDVKVETRASASGTFSGDGKIRNTYNEIVPKEPGAGRAEFPPIAANDYCGRADFEVLSDGQILNRSTSAISPGAVYGWTGSGPTFDVLATVTPGTYCVNGNVKVPNTLGLPTAPLRLSLIVKGSLQVSGNPFLMPDDPDGIMFIADGDIDLNGNSTLTTPNYNGFIYAGAQCRVGGLVTIEGQLVCANRNNDGTSGAWISENLISGTTTIRYGCRGFLSQLWRVLSWYPAPDDA